MSAIQPGEIVTLSPRVRRLTANNPGPLTGPGTNTYLLGKEKIVVLDPGPDEADHISAILRACGGKIHCIVVTHTHDDHSPAAKVLADSTGAPVFGCTYHDDGYQDPTFHADQEIQHGQVISTDELALEAIHTPGHVGNHFCLLLKEEGMLFTGDHIMEGSTVVIIPPSGDMGDYLASLRLLKQYPIRTMAPGHGRQILNPVDYVDYLIQHRLKREQKVVEGLRRAAGPVAIPALTPVVYDDVDPAMHGIASISLWAHLLKLEKEGRARRIPATPANGDFNLDSWQLLP